MQARPGAMINLTTDNAKHSHTCLAAESGSTGMHGAACSRRQAKLRGCTFWQRAALYTLGQMLVQQRPVPIAQLGMALCPPARHSCTPVLTR